MAKRSTAKTASKRSAAKTVARRSAGSAAAKTPKRKSTAGRAAAKKKTTGSAATTKKRTTARRSKSAAPKGNTPANRGTTNRRVTKKTDAKTRAVASPTTQDPIQFPEEKPPPKTYLSAADLREFRDLLLTKRRQIMGDVERLSREALSGTGTAQGERSGMPIHMADVGTDNWEQEFTLGLLANEQSLVREIDNALMRIKNKTYGICLATHKRISKARLRAKPWAQYCIEYARAREDGRAL